MDNLPGGLSSLLGGLGGGQSMDNGMKQRMEDMWKMLDDLADNNPEEYQKFIKGNIEAGMQGVKDDKEKWIKENTRKLKGEYYKYTLVGELEVYPSFKTPGLVETEKFNSPDTGKLFINIFVHPDIKSPETIAIDHRKASKKSLMSLSCTVAVHKDNISSGAKMQVAGNQILNLIQAELAQDGDKPFTAPLGRRASCKRYYKISTENISIKQKYLDSEGKTSIPAEIIIDESRGRDQPSKSQKDEKDQTDGVKDPKDLLKMKEAAKENPKQTQTSLFGGTKTDSQKLEKEKDDSTSKKAPPKPLIEVISSTSDFSSLIKQASIDGSEFCLKISLPEISSIKEVILDVSDQKIIIKKEGEINKTEGTLFEMEVWEIMNQNPQSSSEKISNELSIDSDSVKAKWGKNKHILTLTANVK